MIAYLFSCENATCSVPGAYKEIFKDKEDLVTSPEGWEPGALNLAQGFALKFRTPLVHGEVTRLLLDLEQDQEDCLSEYAVMIPDTARRMEERQWKPYRDLLRKRINEDLHRHPIVLHLMVHTDDKAEGKVVFKTQKGAVLAEEIAAQWRQNLCLHRVNGLHQKDAEISPLAQALAAEYSSKQYAQIHLFVSQSFFLDGKPLRWDVLKKALFASLSSVSVEAPALPTEPETTKVEMV